MKPLSLTLKGFRGIRDGLGRDVIELDFEQLAGDAQLIAMVGKNGRGKTTIMDNMTPFPIMPSRAGADGLGSFSYYDQVCLPESVKDLVWAHGGERYRSQLVFRLNGKRKTEAFLHVRRGDSWQPVRLDDGTVSDGKVDTYVQCVERILGSAETFFTSVFAAQGRRQLSAYKNGEIKTLLADLLGLDEIRVLGAKALETAKLLKAGMVAVRQERAGLARGGRAGRARTLAAGRHRRADRCGADREGGQASRARSGEGGTGETRREPRCSNANGSPPPPTHCGATLPHRGGEGGARCARRAGPAGRRTPGAAERKDQAARGRRTKAPRGAQRPARAAGRNAQGERRDRTGQPQARAGGDRGRAARRASCRNCAGTPSGWTSSGQTASSRASGSRESSGKRGRPR